MMGRGEIHAAAWSAWLDHRDGCPDCLVWVKGDGGTRCERGQAFWRELAESATLSLVESTLGGLK